MIIKNVIKNSHEILIFCLKRTNIDHDCVITIDIYDKYNSKTNIFVVKNPCNVTHNNFVQFMYSYLQLKPNIRSLSRMYSTTYCSLYSNPWVKMWMTMPIYMMPNIKKHKSI